MSTLLVGALLLLVLVVVLSLWQRRAQAATARSAGAPSSVASTPLPTTGGDATTHQSQELRSLWWDGSGTWWSDHEVKVGGAAVSLRIIAGPHGPTEEQRAVVAALLAAPEALDARARPMVVAERRRRGLPATHPELHEVSVDDDAEGGPVGRLWYSFGLFARDIGVSSSDLWQTLTLEVVEPEE